MTHVLICLEREAAGKVLGSCTKSEMRRRVQQHSKVYHSGLLILPTLYCGKKHGLDLHGARPPSSPKA